MPMSRILVLAVSLSAGGAAAWLTMTDGADESNGASIMAPNIVEPVQAATRVEEVLVTAGDLQHRHRITEADLQWQVWPEEAINPNLITRSSNPEAIEEISGQVVRVAMFAGEPLRMEKVTATDTRFLSAMLPAGMRAVAVRITAETTAGGFILPDDRVDVIHTTSASSSDDGTGRGVSRTIASNVKVLAVDQQIDSGSAGGDAVSALGRTATLELNQQQAEIIAAAEASGALSLALRSIADSGQAPEAAEEVERSVRIISGGRSQFVKSK